jgi:alpha/beta superfamily hydrolase
MHLEIPGPAGALEALLDGARPAGKNRGPAAAARPRAAVVFAHPHPQLGGTMHTKAVFQASKGLTRIGCLVLRFNFRGVGSSEGTFDAGRGEMDDYAAALDAMASRYPDVPLWAAGFSFGSWIALETGAADPRVEALIGVAPPLTRGYSFERTLESTKPKFLIQGDLDELCPLKDLWAFYAKLKEPKEIVTISGASHLFEGRTEELGDALEDLLGDFES